MVREMPFAGTPPAVEAGDKIEVQDAAGTWHPATARSGPRYDHSMRAGRTAWLTVAVTTEDGFEVNWGAEKVRPADGREASRG